MKFEPAIDRTDLVSPSVTTILKNWQGSTPVQEIQVAEIDPAFAGGNDFCMHYGISTDEGANCVIVEGSRGSSITIAACVAPVNYRIDFNGVVRKALNARRVSLASLDKVLELTGMEYGSITPIGLPLEWIILLDQRVLLPPHIVIGSGRLKAKLRLPPKALAELPSARVIENLAIR
ncbi:MAG TPA: YbaK/EbsC family protein [Rhabdochlamydiaceae bacterium]|nr:YbaK/EbsC family protein [Rhabdochlamydiaceae bacterium]